MGWRTGSGFSASVASWGDSVQDLTELSAILPADRFDRQVRLVEDEGGFFRWDEQSTLDANGDDVVAASDAPVTGRWIRESGFVARLGRVNTVNAVPALAVGTVVTIPVNTAWLCKMHAVGRQDTGAVVLAQVQTCRVTRIGAGAVLGLPQTDFRNSGDPDLEADIVVSGNNVQVEVTGLAATNISWDVIFELMGAS